MDLDPTVSPKEIHLEVRQPIMKAFLTVKEGSVVQGRFVFEKKEGEVFVGRNSFIGGSTIICVGRVEIGNDVLISWGCTIMDTDAHSLSWTHRREDVIDWKKGIEEGNIGKYKRWDHVKSAPIRIEDKAWIGFNSIILKGVIIGEGAVVAAGSVVTTNVPPFTVVGGNPARVIKEISQ